MRRTVLDKRFNHLLFGRFVDCWEADDAEYADQRISAGLLRVAGDYTLYLRIKPKKGDDFFLPLDKQTALAVLMVLASAVWALVARGDEEWPDPTP